MSIVLAVLLFAINPLQRLSDHVADAALPRVQDNAEYQLVRRHEVSRAAVEAVVMEGTVTEKRSSAITQTHAEGVAT